MSTTTASVVELLDEATGRAQAQRHAKQMIDDFVRNGPPAKRNVVCHTDGVWAYEIRPAGIIAACGLEDAEQLTFIPGSAVTAIRSQRSRVLVDTASTTSQVAITFTSAREAALFAGRVQRTLFPA